MIETLGACSMPVASSPPRIGRPGLDARSALEALGGLGNGRFNIVALATF
jgi:hypothetical protein